MAFTVYSKPVCPGCKSTKDLLTALGAEFTVVDISEDLEAREMILGLGFRSVPVVFAGEEKWVGHNESKIKAAFEALN